MSGGPDATRRAVLAAAVLSVTGVRAQPADAVALARQLVDAMTANDAVRLRALFAPQAWQAYGDAAPKRGEAFFAWLQSDIIDRAGRVDDAQVEADGNAAVITGRYRNNRGYRSAANFLITAEAGRIVGWRMRY